jgi:hypothetical protein
MHQLQLRTHDVHNNLVSLGHIQHIENLISML